MNAISLLSDPAADQAPYDADMANFARTFKSPSYLTPRRRPAIPGRTFSNSSELSMASSNSNNAQPDDSHDLPVTSAPNTPGLFAESPAYEHDEVFPLSPSPVSSRPIAIEAPKWKRIKSTETRTPPAPLSARGELPGGYFPLHEDPGARVHHPHPFHQDSKLARHKSISLAAESAPMHEPLSPQPVPATTTAAMPPTNTSHNMPIASYYPSGFHDTPLPMGKYYPTNYEQRSQSRQSSSKSSFVGTPSSRPGSVHSQGPSASPEKPSAAEVQRRMEQYKRDMAMQTRMVWMSAAKNSGKSTLAVPVQSPHFKDVRLLSSTGKPLAPKLGPLGSPGPVTPIDLGGDEGYLAKGKAPESLFGLTSQS
jgi:hypothetical protein